MLGSFLNVVAFRLPRGESLVRPSHCPSCGAAVRPYDNVPVLSWLWLRGRCRPCGERISPRYPVVEAVTALLFVAVLAVEGVDADALPGLALVLLLVPTALIDLEYRIIPNALMAVGAGAGLALGALTDASQLSEHPIAAAAAGGVFFAGVLAGPAGVGVGGGQVGGGGGRVLLRGRARVPGGHGDGRRQAGGGARPVPRRVGDPGPGGCAAGRHAGRRGRHRPHGGEGRAQDRGPVRPVPRAGRHRRPACGTGDDRLVPEDLRRRLAIPDPGSSSMTRTQGAWRALHASD